MDTTQSTWSHSLHVFIAALLQGTDWLLEKSERMLHSCVVQDARTVVLRVDEMSMAGELDLARLPVYVEGCFRTSATEWILGEEIGFCIKFSVCSFPAQFWKKHLSCNRNFFSGMMGKVGADTQSWDLWTRRSQGYCLCDKLLCGKAVDITVPFS